MPRENLGHRTLPATRALRYAIQETLFHKQGTKQVHTNRQQNKTPMYTVQLMHGKAYEEYVNSLTRERLYTHMPTITCMHACMHAYKHVYNIL